MALPAIAEYLNLIYCHKTVIAEILTPSVRAGIYMVSIREKMSPAPRARTIVADRTVNPKQQFRVKYFIEEQDMSTDCRSHVHLSADKSERSSVTLTVR